MKSGDIKIGGEYLMIGTGYHSNFKLGLRGRGRFVASEAPKGGLVRGKVYEWETSTSLADPVRDGTPVTVPTRLLAGPYEDALNALNAKEEAEQAAERRLKYQNDNANAIRRALRQNGLAGDDVAHLSDSWLFGGRVKLEIGTRNFEALARRLGVKLPHPEVAAEDRKNKGQR
jgi:hypothetical protein